MTAKDKGGASPNNDEQQDVAAASPAATATIDAPKEPANEQPTKREYQDNDKVTVLHGWGRVESNDLHFVDKVLFKGGIARDVLYGVAKHWVANTRPDGKQELVYGKVDVHILPADATEADFMKVTGIKPMPMKDFAAMLEGVDLDVLVTQMGADKVKKLIDGLDTRLPAGERRR